MRRKAISSLACVQQLRRWFEATRDIDKNNQGASKLSKSTKYAVLMVELGMDQRACWMRVGDEARQRIMRSEWRGEAGPALTRAAERSERRLNEVCGPEIHFTSLLKVA